LRPKSERRREHLGSVAGAPNVTLSIIQSLALAHRAYVFENGFFVLQGSAAHLSNDPTLRRAYLGLQGKVTRGLRNKPFWEGDGLQWTSGLSEIHA
jgi:hypothetical protein